MWRLRLSLAVAICFCTLALGGISLPVEVSGRVLDAGWDPVAGATALLLVDGHVASQATTGSGGSFHLSGAHLYDGYQVTVSAAGFVPAGLDARTGTVLLHQLGSIAGQVVDETGAPVAFATVSLGQPGRPGAWMAEADAQGWFAFNRALDPGSFHLLVQAPSHDPFAAVVRADQDQLHTVSPVLSRQLGTLSLSTDPAGIRMLLDGQPMPDCPATPCAPAVAVGQHVLSVGDDLYVPWQQTVSLQRKQTFSVAQHIERKTGTLVVNGPAGDLRVDGNAVSPGWRGLIPTGAHSISYRAAGSWPSVANAQVNWNQETNISVSGTPVATGDPNAFISGMNAYLNSLGGHYSVYLQNLSSGQEMGSGQNDVMEAASVIKIPVAIYTYQQAAANKFSLDDKVTLEGRDFMPGTGSLYGRANSGDQYSYRDLVALLIQQSDNTAWQALRRVLGASAIDGYAASIGAPDCHQNSDNCTAREAGVMIAQLYRGKLLSSTDTQALLKLFETTIYNDRINYYLGGTTVAHKVGMDGGVINDTGVVLLSGKPFVISMFTATDDSNKGVQSIRDVARAAYWFYSH